VVSQCSDRWCNDTVGFVVHTCTTLTALCRNRQKHGACMRQVISQTIITSLTSTSASGTAKGQARCKRTHSCTSHLQWRHGCPRLVTVTGTVTSHVFLYVEPLEDHLVAFSDPCSLLEQSSPHMRSGCSACKKLYPCLNDPASITCKELLNTWETAVRTAGSFRNCGMH
jgi:hypothetical protein